MNMTLLVHYVTARNYESNSTPINVSYNSQYIKFGWLVDKNATAHAGDLKFEIQAIGANSKGDEYIWKTKPNGVLNVLQSLSGNGVIEPDDSWITAFLTQVTEKVAEAQTAASEAQTAASEAKTAANTAVNSVNNAIATKLKDYYTSAQVDKLLENIDLTDVYNKIDSIDGLAKFNVTYDSSTNVLKFYNGTAVMKSITLNSDPSAAWVSSYNATVDSKISDAVSSVTTTLSDYQTKTDADLASIHNSIDDLPETLKSDYYTKTDTDTLLKTKADGTDITNLTSQIGVVEQNVNTNKTSITAFGTKLAELEDSVNSIDTSPRKTYDASYGEDYIYTLWEIEDEGTDDEVRTAKSSFKIVGGSGSSETSSVLKIEYITKSPLVVTTSDDVIIKYKFSGTDSSGDDVLDGAYTWKIGSSIIATGTAVNGENSFDATNFVSIGTQKLVLSITDDAGSLVTKTWTVQKIDVRLESSFNDTLTYGTGAVLFDYTPYGAISKTVHFVLDGIEIDTVVTSSSGIPMSYDLPAQKHGAHLLDVYITAELTGSTIESNHIYKDILWYNSESSIPVIGCVQTDFTAKQYDTTNITYTVYDPNTETPTVTLAVDESIVSTLVLDSNTQIWQYKSTDIGSHVLTITCRDTVKTLNVTIEKLDIDVEPVTAGLEFDFNPVGKSNNDSDRIWSDNDVTMSVSENFDWTNGGYQLDDNGDQYFCIKAGTTATINYNLFADDARRNGKEFKIIFKTSNVRKSDAVFLTCQSGDSTIIGLQMNVHEAYIRSSANSLYIPYSEEDIIEFEFNISKDTDIPLVMSYEDGTPCRPMIYTSDHSFTQTTPVPITIGSEDCDIAIYRMKAYSQSLSTTAILSNFIADARTATEMIDRYNRNQIYDENNLLTPESVAEALPNMRVIKIEAPHFTNDKKDYVKNTSMECIYKNGDATLDNWKFTNAVHAGQGTTSNEYGAAGRNIDVICCFDGIHQVNSKITFDPDYKTQLVLGDGTTYTDGDGKVSLTRTSVPNNWFNFKVNIASSEMCNNAYLQKRYNTYLPYSTPATRRDSKIKNDMEFVNCIIFLKENDPDVSTHREFDNCEWHYYALGNMGDSKKTDVTRAYDPDDMNEFCIEISDNTLDNSTFQTGVTDSEGNMVYPITKDQWVSGNTKYDSLYNNWDDSFEFRYDCCGDSKDGEVTSTDEIKAEIRTKNRQIWRDFYKFVITSTDDEFVNNLQNWFIVDSATYFYLFTLRYTMIDNRAKNTFWHWAKHYITADEATSLGDKANYYTIDDTAAAINNGYRFDLWNYDDDSALGINNSGELTMTYGKEDMDYRTDDDPSSGYIFNAAESVFFCRIRDLMGTQLRTMYQSRESEGCWSASSLINQWDEMQNEWCEELWRLDYVRKYERTYRDGNTRFLTSMMNGKKKYQRRQFERDQEMYMATKFLGTTATSDQIMFRCNTPKDAVVKPDYTLHLTPYSNMYLSVMFGNSSAKQIRAKAGVQYDIECPYDTMDDTAVLVYAASRIQSMGDVSVCYIHDNDFSKAEKLKELIIGNATDGYSNTFLTNLVIGNNKLLEILDIRNTPNLQQTLDLSQCGNLTTLYATGSGLTGILFASGGKIQTALLPATLTSINMKNLIYLTNLELAGCDYITTIVLENCDVINAQDLLENAKNVNRVRILGINWTLEDTSLLDRLYGMSGLDKSGYNTEQSVVTGKVHVPIMKEKKLADYNEAWSDLEITYDTLVAQYTVSFYNDDGETLLDRQYVDKGEKPVDPITREDNPISTPVKESSKQYDYTFAGWDSNFVATFADTKILATYTSSVRQYTVRYLNKGTVVQTVKADYGSTVFYTGDTPVYTLEEAAYKYYLFDRWDSSGYVLGDKDINAVYDVCEYNLGYFDNKDLSDLSPVEIYAMLKLGLESESVEIKDSFSITMGNDYDFDDIDSYELINSETVFTGKNYVDSNLTVLNGDRDFVFAIDYKLTSGTIAQCYKSDGSLGFKIDSSNVTWNTSTAEASAVGNRDIVILRHVKGSNELHVYRGSLPAQKISYNTLSSSKVAVSANSTLVFGGVKADDGYFEDYAVGNVYWAKIWYGDLGDTACRNLAAWTHETIELEMYGFRRYYLSNNSGSRSSMSFIASHALDNTLEFSSASTNTGGWEKSSINTLLNGRFYEAIPLKWRQLIKQVKITSSIGDKSSEVSSSDCYVAIPSIIEIDGSMSTTPYTNEGSAIPFIISDETRKRLMQNGEETSYWTRSPNVRYNTYIWTVNSDGSTTGYTYCTSTDKRVVIILSM